MGAENADDSRLPPGQTLTRRAPFPVVGETAPGRPIDLGAWRLEVGGAVENGAVLTYAEVLALPQSTFTADIHCVTGWSQFDVSFTGVRFRDFVAGLGLDVAPGARFVRFAADSARGHDSSLPLATALEDSWLVHSANGAPLSPERGYPLRVVTPSKYFYKSLKWVRGIEFLEEDRPGYWERTSGYHNNADPWREERLEASRFTSAEEAEAFRGLADFGAYRGEGAGEGGDGAARPAAVVIVKANLQRWSPRTRNLHGLQLKACNFRDARLAGCDFRGANLSLSKFPGADLEGADFTGADLEGADFTGARLAGAVFHHNALCGTTFHARRGPPRGLATHAGMSVVEPRGLLEAEADYLRSIGVLI